MILARRMNLALARRTFGTKVTLATTYPANVHTVNEDQATVDAMELNPDRNIEYVNSLHDPLVTRPFMLGMPGTETASLRELESGAWGDISQADQLKLYRAAYKSSVPEMLQGTDMWKGVVGMGFTYYALMCWIFFYSFYVIHDEKPQKSGLWFMYHDGWQQHRKNQAAETLFWENRTCEARNDCEWWDWEKHCWKNPNQLRFDEDL
jgi:hypothetical protein